jgi:serine protease AprX
MDRRQHVIYAAVVVLGLMALAASAPSGFLGKLALGTVNEKIDPALARQLEGLGDVKMPVIVLLKAGESPGLEDLDVRYRYHLIHAVAGGAGPLAIKRLALSEGVEGIYLDGDVRVAKPGGPQSGNETICPAKDIGSDRLWAEGIDGRGVIVAVIDSGIDRSHPDLAGRIVGEKNFVPDEPGPDDRLGHGTMVAGIIAGSGAASGGRYKGVAPGASLLNVKVIDRNGNGKVSDIIAGIEWALDNNADVLSLSLAGLNLGETNPPVTMAADNAMDAGAVVCVASGNNG